MSDANGAFTGSFTFDGYQTVNEGGRPLTTEDGGTATIRDAGNNVVAVFPGAASAVAGTRMAVGAPGFPEAHAASPSPAP